MSLGVRLWKFYRRRVGMTQAQVAEKSGFSREYVKKIEGGQIPPVSTVEQLGATMHLEPDELAGLLSLMDVTPHHSDGAIQADNASAEESAGPATNLRYSYGDGCEAGLARLVGDQDGSGSVSRSLGRF